MAVKPLLLLGANPNQMLSLNKHVWFLREKRVKIDSINSIWLEPKQIYIYFFL